MHELILYFVEIKNVFVLLNFESHVLIFLFKIESSRAEPARFKIKHSSLARAWTSSLFSNPSPSFTLARLSSAREQPEFYPTWYSG
ncbi:hypothetical protein HanIR_Chr09g0436301 [Helianthus annuus]|nr:hypothetical protein HanIR_Chr09g0436301 [Helianthus annuus]